jgi:hypothetical protein
MSDNEKRFVICKICKQKVKARKSNNWAGFPIQHNNPETGDKCHGFFEEGLVV